ncbi:MAG: AraC family transcriptional regulator [Bacteroidetes bacterium]|nr:AraC family transcriptional regulator [Bacteroidota bacterium]
MEKFNIEINSLIVILIFGSLVLLSFLIIVNPLQVNRKGNYWLGTTILLWASYWIEEIISLVAIIPSDSLFFNLLRFFQYFTPIIFYFSVVFFTNPSYCFKRNDLKYIILPVVYTCLLLYKYTLPGQGSHIFDLLLTLLVILQIPVYTIASYLKIRKHQKRIQLFSSTTHEIDLSWLEYIIISVLVISSFTVIYNILFALTSLNLFMNLMFLLVIYNVAYFSLRQKQIFPRDEWQRSEIILLEEDETIGEGRKKLIPDEELKAYKSRLETMMETLEPYLNSELNLIRLSELMNMTPHQLSYLINTAFNENFFQFINRYRVEKAKELLIKESMNQFSILGIAFESGFNSKTSFNTTFKKFTNQTPSEYKKRSSSL